MMPRVSVVIPTYNYGRFVTEAVDSALAQELAPLEVIVVDDGSTGDTRERLEPYRDRIRYVFQENRGLSGARNTGIETAQGDWIALLDSDDLWHPQKLAVQFGVAADDSTVSFFGNPSVRDLPDRIPTSGQLRRLAVKDFLGRIPFGPSSVVVRRSCFQKVGNFDETLRSVEDRDMWLRLACHFVGGVVDVGCWHYRLHPEQMNRNPERMSVNYARVLDRFFEANPQHGHLASFAWAYWNLDGAISYLEAGQRATAARFLLRSLWLHPGRIRRDQRGRLLRLKLLTRTLLT